MVVIIILLAIVMTTMNTMIVPMRTPDAVKQGPFGRLLDALGNYSTCFWGPGRVLSRPLPLLLLVDVVLVIVVLVVVVVVVSVVCWSPQVLRQLRGVVRLSAT